ncbi:hypothetical protein ACD661_16985, partial [Legionella lytica]
YSQVGSLETQVEELNKEQTRLQDLVRNEQRTVNEAQATLIKKAQELDAATDKIQQLQHEAEATAREYARQVDELQLIIAQKDEHSEGATV